MRPPLRIYCRRCWPGPTWGRCCKVDCGGRRRSARPMPAHPGPSRRSANCRAAPWVRAAVGAGDYDKALEGIEQMPASLATQPRWRYWRARAVAATRGPEDAAALFAEIAGMRDYYGYLAADRLHRSYDLNIQPSADDEAVQASLAMEPGMMRAHALIDCGMPDEAGAEWSAALATAQPALKVQAAHLASRWGWYGQTIATLAQANEWADVPLRYPRPYMSEIEHASKLTRVPTDWILAVMRQESLFRKDAVSRADARGLMQMLP